MESKQLYSAGLLCLLVLFTPPATMAAEPNPVDSIAVSRALNQALESAKTGTRTRWSGTSGHYGFITINRTFFPKTDTPCRDYVRTIHNPGKDPTRLRGTGCRDENGNWLLQETYSGGASTAGVSKADKPSRKPECRPLPEKPRSVKKRSKKKVVASAPPIEKVNPAQAVVSSASRPSAADW